MHTTKLFSPKAIKATCAPWFLLTMKSYNMPGNAPRCLLTMMSYNIPGNYDVLQYVR